MKNEKLEYKEIAQKVKNIVEGKINFDSFEK